MTLDFMDVWDKRKSTKRVFFLFAIILETKFKLITEPRSIKFVIIKHVFFLIILVPFSC